MRLYAIGLAAAAGLFAAAPLAQAATVFDNGAPDGDAGIFVSTGFVAADFTLGAEKDLTGASIILTSADEGVSVLGASIFYQLYADTGSGPGALLQSGQAENVSVTDQDLPSTLRVEKKVQFDFRDLFQAQADTTYWLAIHATDTFDTRSIVWEEHFISSGRHPQHSEDDIHFDEVTDPFDVAFTLQDASAGGVPEPAAWTMMIGGFGLAGAALRRRRAVAVAVAAGT